ncbi:hypothetical protein N9X46_06365 [Paracoccaceae bacterium]|nr:hypothetical protein [Paracoccaceae bacterium]
MSQTILMRCDSSPSAGAGHLKRCTVLAQSLKKLGFSTIFAIDENTDLFPLDICFPIHRIAYSYDELLDANAVKTLAKKIGTKIVLGDSYRISHAWVAELRSAGLIVLLIDDLGIGGDAFLRIDYSPMPKSPKGNAHSLLGPSYFITDSQRFRAHSSPPKRMIAHAGGTGNFAAAPEVYAAAALVSKNAETDMTWLCPTEASREWLQINGLIKDDHKVIAWQQDKTDLWSNFDIVIGPASTSLFEVILQGALPISFPLSPTQTSDRNHWLQIGHALHLVREELNSKEFAEHLIQLSIDHFDCFRSQLDAFAEELDGNGAARCSLAIAKLLAGKLHDKANEKTCEAKTREATIRKCDIRDAHLFLLARNAHHVRSLSTDPNHIIKWHEHLQWWLNQSIERFIVDGMADPVAFFWHKPVKAKGCDYLIGGWFPAGNSPAFTAAIRLLDWQLEYCSDKYPEHVWLASIKKENRAVQLLNRRYGFIDGDSYSLQAAKELFPRTTEDFIILQRKARSS